MSDPKPYRYDLWKVFSDRGLILLDSELEDVLAEIRNALRIEKTQEPKHFRVARWSGENGCERCGHGVMWTVVFGVGAGETEIGQAWGDAELVEDICDLMNDAFEAGMVHGRVA